MIALPMPLNDSTSFFFGIRMAFCFGVLRSASRSPGLGVHDRHRLFFSFRFVFRFLRPVTHKLLCDERHLTDWQSYGVYRFTTSRYHHSHPTRNPLCHTTAAKVQWCGFRSTQISDALRLNSHFGPALVRLGDRVIFHILCVYTCP